MSDDDTSFASAASNTRDARAAHDSRVAKCPLFDHASFAHGTPRARIAELRAEHSLYHERDAQGRAYWVVLAPDLIDIVLKDPARFSSSQGPLIDDFPAEILAEQARSLNFLDPPAQRSYRSIVDWAFRPAAIEQRRASMREQARAIVDAVQARGRCELVSEIAQPLPVQVMCALFGIPAADAPRIVALVNTLTLAEDPEYAESREAGFLASMQVIDYGAALAAAHRREPRDSMTMDIISGEGPHGAGLDDREFGRFFNNLIVGGVETTRNTLAWAMFELIRHPDQWRMLQQDEALVEDAVEETLRHRNTVVYLRRTSTAAQQLGGEAIAAGDKLVCVLGSPNRDPQLFADPDRFDITRPRRENVRRHYRTFGAGPHFCIGVHQARTNLCVMLEELVRRWDQPRLLGEPERARSVFMDGFKRMQVGFTARS
jgi:cholest-4-en-3-one 26-monooxygenase